MYNESRGRDNCGYYWNGHIDKGINLDSDFSVFIANNKLEPGLLKTKLFMGHTRKKTCGSSDFDAAHPHIINNNYVQTHNGSIKNVWTMCNDHDINHSKIHVDSLGLAFLIEKVGLKPILENYKGYATLAFTYVSNPEVLYLYHGASRETKDGQLMEERPLFFLHQPEGIYYSSMINSLHAINSEPNKYTPFILKHNIVWEILNGEFTKNSLSISREDNNIQMYNYPPSKYTNYQSTTAIQRVLPLEEEDNDDDIITGEVLPELDRNMIGSIFYNRGKYYKVAESKINSLYNIMLNGEFIINRDGYFIDKPPTEALEPREERYYFINGIMLKSKEVYQKFIADFISGYTEQTFETLSTGSKYPIIQIKNVQNVGKTLWFHYGKKVKKHTFCPKFSQKAYKIRFGKTKQIYVHHKSIVSTPQPSDTKAKTAETSR